MGKIKWYMVLIVTVCIVAGQMYSHPVLGFLSSFMFASFFFYDISRDESIERYIKDKDVRAVQMVTKAVNVVGNQVELTLNAIDKSVDNSGDGTRKFEYTLNEYNRLIQYKDLVPGIGSIQNLVYSVNDDKIIGYSDNAYEAVSISSRFHWTFHVGLMMATVVTGSLILGYIVTM